MNDQLQSALVAIINKANQGVDVGVSFLQAQLPDVIQQLLQWKFTLSVMSSVSAVLGAIAIFILATRGLRTAKKCQEMWAKANATSYSDPAYRDLYAQSRSMGDGDGVAVAAVVGFGLSALLLFGGIVSSFNAVQILIAPKLYLIEYAASLAKGG